jgi:uncharacterized peroxidase-related enzyme
MVLPEYEKIAGAFRNPGQRRPSNLAVIEECAATGEVAALYDHFRTHFGRPDVPGILKCFATHPPLLRHMMDLSETLIFADGHLSRKHKEMIATLVSTQNACSYCVDSHAYFLRMHGGSSEVLAAIRKNDLESPALTAAEQALLRFARKVNFSSHEIGPADVSQALAAGWNKQQIAEAVHVAALFSTFNRVADAFGLASQGLLALYDGGPDNEPSGNTSVKER